MLKSPTRYSGSVWAATWSRTAANSVTKFAATAAALGRGGRYTTSSDSANAQQLEGGRLDGDGDRRQRNARSGDNDDAAVVDSATVIVGSTRARPIDDVKAGTAQTT